MDLAAALPGAKLSYIKRLLCFLMVVTLVFSILSPPMVQAVALVDDAAIIVAAIMNSFNLHIGSDTADNLAQGVYTLWQQRQTKIGGPSFAEAFADWGKSCVVKIDKASKAQMEIKQDMLTKVVDFVKWIQNSYKLNSAPTVIGGGDMTLTVGGGEIYIGGYRVWKNVPAGNDLQFSSVFPNEPCTIRPFSSFPDFYITRSFSGSSFKTVYHCTGGNDFSIFDPIAGFCLEYDGKKFHFRLLGAEDATTTRITKYAVDYTSNIALCDRLLEVYSSGLVVGQATILSPGVVTVPNVGAMAKNECLVIDTGLALGANVTLPQVIAGVKEHLVAGDLAATNTISKAETKPGEITDVNDLGLPSLSAIITTRFPFSIPWDIARGIKLVAAPAKAPYWKVDFLAPIGNRVGGWKGDTAVEIDMSKYPIVGQLCRWTSTIGFCLLLAAATKKLSWVS